MVSPDSIAAVALRAYDKLPGRGKNKSKEWSVLAAFVLEAPRTLTTGGDELTDSLTTIAIGTGSKCVGRGTLDAAVASGCAGGILRDSHAEVVARRALRCLLLSEIEARFLGQGRATAPVNNAASDAPTNWLLEDVEPLKGKSVRFRLRSDARLHLYVSEPPCGDAAIFELNSATACAADNGLNFTGAKRLLLPRETKDTGLASGGESYEEGDGTVREPGAQELGALRIKSCRSDLRYFSGRSKPFAMK